MTTITLSKPGNFSIGLFSILALTLGSLLFGTAHAEKDVLFSGTGFENVKKSTKGGWQIVEENGSVYVDFTDDFKVRRAPDLKIFLSTAGASSITDRNALDNSVFVAELTSFKGAARYEIPAGISVGDYETLIIHCEQYTKLWAATPLQ